MSKETPVHEIRLGKCKAAIWLNQTDSGPRYNVSFSRIYKTEKGWESSSSFGRDELPLVSKVCRHGTHMDLRAKRAIRRSSIGFWYYRTPSQECDSLAIGTAFNLPNRERLSFYLWFHASSNLSHYSSEGRSINLRTPWTLLARGGP